MASARDAREAKDYSPGSPVNTVSVFESEPEAPLLSVTVTVMVKLPKM